MKLSLWWLLTFVATTSLFSTADAKPTTGKQDAGVDRKVGGLHHSWPTYQSSSGPQTITGKQQSIKPNTSKPLINNDEIKTAELIYQPQQNSLYGFIQRWPGLQPPGLQQPFLPQPGLQQSTQFFYQKPQFPNIPQFFFTSPGFVYPITTITPSFPIPPPIVPPTATTTTTERPSKKKEREPTTARPFAKQLGARALANKAETQTTDQLDFRNDANLLAGVRKINPNFMIEDILPVPGRHIFSENTIAKVENGPTHRDIISLPENKETSQEAIKQGKRKSSVNSNKKPAVKVEATGKTATSGSIPEIPFGTYFLPYLSQKRIGSGNKIASLILEPHSKAVVGNGGTAISKPISRAILKKGVPTNVYFNPESVAIAGVGGKAHAQAELELDLISR